MDLNDFLVMLRRRWLLIVIWAAAGAAVAFDATQMMTPKFSSSVGLFVTTPKSSTMAAYQGDLFSQERVKSYAEVVPGDRLARAVKERVDLEIPVGQVKRQLSATTQDGTVLLRITATAESPERAKRMAAAAGSELREIVSTIEKTPDRKKAPIKVTVVDHAHVEPTPVSPRPVRDTSLGLVLGLLLGAGLAMLRETLDKTVKNAEDIEELTGASPLGTIGYDPHANSQPLLSDLSSYAPRAEAFRVLRTNLQFVDVDEQPKIIVVTSSIAAEGKTTTAINVALTLTEAGHRVTLVEGDLRRPKINDYLGMERAVGLTTVLIGRIELEDALQSWNGAPLRVLTSGQIPPNPSELLQTTAVSQILRRLAADSDVVLVDAPPLLPVTDAALLAAHADGAILIARHGTTTTDQIKQSLTHLRAVDGRLLGVVLNMAPAKGPDSYAYGYGYGYAPAQLVQSQLERNPNGTAWSNPQDLDRHSEGVVIR